mmetsp:Transcript_779/g.1959  ORF Transcript_779/g.1959 Transcript_779/m.1959 type:complete len:514 (+) Transcript_779:122-1663(+)|eukprot:CAMPEP_0202375380 /NCGR_PEP_ID=MMETSP1127-20130417/6058_1 /ASSEMBLY_ACC=CAM_ASM_000462 /TAXON_ID=3047 /ORGANISM="Dunaliella tertiolecta, Strain CCMP1320" /LENGTH=513 /DNA_ID=CAMNT_0048972829 /DNA_START=198 /DNA_END=1739 /DNA_ORIENTATION=+
MSNSDSEEELVGNKRKARPHDAIVDHALKEEDEEKRQRKIKKAKASGKTLAEIEEEEGGPIKESKVGMAQTQRALGRKAKPVQDEAGNVAVEGTDVNKFEENVQVEEEEGIRFTGFNLNEERETGHFDDQGNYVEAKDKGEKDAWMASDEAKVVSAEVRQKLEARRAEEARLDAQKRAPLTDRQIAELKNELAGHMLPGEGLTRALKRISGSSAQQTKAMGKRERMRLQQQQQQQQAAQEQTKKPKWQQGGAAQGPSSTPSGDVFTRMTEIADLLVLEGEVDVYDCTREDLLRFAEMWLPKKPAAPEPNTPAAVAAAAADEDDDMFGGDDTFEKSRESQAAAAAAAAAPPAATEGGTATGGGVNTGQAEAQAGSTTAAAPAAAAAAAAPAPAAAASLVTDGGAAETSGAGEEVDYSSWPIKELKRCLQERGVDASQIVEKDELIAKVREVAAQPGVGSNQTFDVPFGYVFDPESGYFHNPEAGMYFDNNTGLFAAGGRWYVASGDKFIEYTGA